MESKREAATLAVVENGDRQRRLSQASIVSRGKWGSKWEFLLSCIGLSVGIGNVWRFPYLAYENGGGAFLIPYLLMLFLVGKPMYFLELAFGQFAGVGPLAIWKCVPIAKGIGFAMVTVCLVICIYYNVIMSYCIFFIGSSFHAVLPWTRCDLPWAENTTCMNSEERKNVLQQNLSMPNGTQYSSALYFNRYVLDITEGLGDIGGIKWDLSLCLLLSWMIVVVCLVKGIKTSGKVVYFAATFPYVILLTLLVVGLLQKGAGKGVMYFIEPQWEKLLDIKVWQAAAGQMFFSLSVSMGALIMYSSFNDFRNNVFRDAMVVSVMDTLTSLIAGLVIFSVLGAMADEMGVDIKNVVAGGPGLAFIAYPDALARLPIPQLFSVLFFLMLFILGLDSEFALLENVLTSISDEFPILRKYKIWFCISTSAFCYLVGLVFVTNGGLHILDIVDTFGGTLSIIFIAVFECVAITWLYGLRNLCADIKYMLGREVGWYWKATWMVTSPVILGFILIYSLVTHKSLESTGKPLWADALGWVMVMISVLQIPVWALIMVFKQPGSTLAMKFRKSLQPTEDWGPSNPEVRAHWRAQKMNAMGVAPATRENEHYPVKIPSSNGSYNNPAFSEHL